MGGTEMAAYIKFEGIEGEAQDKDHKGWSDIAQFGQAIHKPGSGTGPTRRRGDVVLEDILVSKELDKARLAARSLQARVQSAWRFRIKRRCA